MKAATAVENSENSKLGNCSATYVSQASCPASCPLLRNGCYAETGHVGIITARLGRSGLGGAVLLAREHAREIDRLSGARMLRLNVVGDCRTNQAAEIVSKAAKRYNRRYTSARKVWTFAHAWRDVKRKSWGEVSVLASCESVKEARIAMRAGYAAAAIVPEFTSEKVYEQEGVKILPCPNQTRGVTCDKCALCLNDERLRKAGIVIGFVPHGAGARAVRNTLKSLEVIA